ncbi:MAG: hypothetical protein HYZ89_00545 [Candidatus Omnitrophica bacterium]|nr:hypothetical protein [Candidatus Omnitrophota bacterium]
MSSPIHGRLATLTIRAVRQQIDDVIVSRGIAYWRRGRVTRLIRRGDELDAFVAGSRAIPYHVACLERPGRRLQCRCSCP